MTTAIGDVARTRFFAPGRAFARWKSARHAVAYGTPIAAPCAKERRSGSRWIRFAAHSAVTFVRGPSRTADIEMTLTHGVHGPKHLHVIVMP